MEKRKFLLWKEVNISGGVLGEKQRVNEKVTMDDKTLFEINEGKRGSVGLNNTRWRVRYIYGKDAKLVAEHGNENTKEGTKITIILP